MTTFTRAGLVAGICVVAVAARAAEPRFSGEGAGTAENPYRIATVRQLQQMQFDLKAHYRLIEDIDAFETADWNDGAGFEPVGTAEAGFSGTLDGGGHAIIGLHIKRPEQDHVGLFGQLLHGNLVRVRVLGARVVGRDCVGILAGRDSDQYRYGLITKQCATSGTVQGRRQVGGLVGQIYDAQMEDCFSTARVTGEFRTGGLVGYVSFSQLRRCYASGAVSGREAAGGLTGGIDGHPSGWATIQSCFAVGRIDAAGPDVGGLNGAVTRDNKFIHWIASYHADARHDSPYGTYERRVSAFQGNRTHPVFSTWEFPGVWRLVADPAAYPALACHSDTTVPRALNWPFDGEEAKRRQQAAARRLATPATTTIALGTDASMGFALIPEGEFVMGSPQDEPGRRPADGPLHTVRISRPFYMAVTEVTQAQYAAVMDSNPSRFKSDKLPVEGTTWDDAAAFCRLLTERERKAGRLRRDEEYRLPTEAEWECACRAGASTAYGFGDDPGKLSDFAWFDDNSAEPQRRPRAVATRKPNALGLYDMHGNVWEWCADWFGPYLQGLQVDPKGPASGTTRVVRGGCWCEKADWLRAGCRHQLGPGVISSQVGFRCVRTIARPSLKSPLAKLLTTLSGAQYVDAIKVLADRPNELLICTQNVGARCGGGTPATMWKLVLDPTTGTVRSLDRKQSLDQVQQVRQVIFQASDGTLFTGGGWCGFKPPYYSTDRGESWRPATKGTYPPNSTYCLAEFKGKVYAGTGYEPHHAQVYRWLGDGAWERVFDIEPPRSIFRTMAAFKDRLFVGSKIYWANAKPSGIPVYLSADGKEFVATKGIPNTHSVNALLPAGSEFYALTAGPLGKDLYRWTGQRWEDWAKFPIDGPAWPVASSSGTIYAAGKMASRQGVFATRDGGRAWNEVAALDSPTPMSLENCGCKLYVGTVADADSKGYVYQLDVSAWERPDAGPKAESPLANVQMEVAAIVVDHAAVEEQVSGRFTVRNVGPAFDIPNGVVNPGYGVFILDVNGKVLFRTFGGISGPFPETREVTVGFNTSRNSLEVISGPPFIIPRAGTFILQVAFYRDPERKGVICEMSTPFAVK